MKSLNPGTDMMSVFEIFYTLHKPEQVSPSQDFMDLKSRFSGKQVVIVDNAERVTQEVKNFLMDVSPDRSLFSLGK
jgi:hypothetical protein